MKKRLFKQIVMILVFTLILQLLPLSPQAFAAEEQHYALTNEAPAGLVFRSEPVFSRNGYESKLKCKYNTAWYDYGSYQLFLDETGNPITSEKLSSVWMVFGHLQTAKPQGSSNYAVYWKGKRITQPIYTDFIEEGDCLIAIKGGGRDFFGLDGKQRIPRSLPSGWEPRKVSAVGTVVARKYNPDVYDSIGTKYYNEALFDQNGNKLYEHGFYVTDEEEGIYLYTDQLLRISGGAFMDLYGNFYGAMYGDPDNPRFVSKTGNSVFEVSDRDHKRLGSFEATSFRDTVGSALIIERDGRCGMVDQNGNVVVDPVYLYFEPSQIISYQMPQIRAVMFETLDHKYVVYNDRGVKLGEYQEPVSIYPNCMVRSGSDGSTYVYDTNGTLTKRYDAGMSFQTMNGVCFLCDGSSSLYYVVDLYGNRLSELGFSTIRKDFESLYGLVNVCRGSAWYVVNAAGAVVNREKMDRPVDFQFTAAAKQAPEEMLAVYSMNGKNGICRYIPPVTPCEKNEGGIHEWAVSKVLKAASCTEAGEAVFRCTHCGKTRTEATPVNPEAHSWTLTEILTEPGVEGIHSGVGLYTCTRCGETREDRLCAGMVFTDMPADDNWAHAAIDWAYFGGVTSGKTATTFAPKATVTRAEVVSFLYKAMGSPEPAVTENPFTDVAEGKYYYNPVLWAVGAGVTTGATPTSFAPRKNCTRAQIVSFLWNAAGRPEPSLTENPFPDVSENKYYYKAVLWAYENHVTGGVSATAFGPNRVCTRAQTVTFLYKAVDLLPAGPRPQEP